MNRKLLIPIVAALLLGAGSPQAQEKPKAPSPTPSVSPAPEQTPTFPAQVELVTVDVVVTDKKGASVLGLNQEAFTLSEDGKPQTISSFEAIHLPAAPAVTAAPRPKLSTNNDPHARTGRSFVVVFDDVHLSPFQAQRAKGAVAAFLKSGVREGDRVTLVATGGGAWWSARMEAGRDELITLLKHLEGRLIPQMGNDRVTDYEAMKIHVYRDQQTIDRVGRRFDTFGVNPGGRQNSSGSSGSSQTNLGDGDPQVLARASEVYFQALSRNRITLEVIERILNSMTAAKGRKSMILVSEGFIYDPNMDEFKRVIEASRRSNVAIYFLDTEGLGGMSPYMTAEFGPAIDNQDLGAAFAENMERAEGAESIAADSGGFSVKNTNDLTKGIQRIADESRGYYLLGYVPSNTKRDGRFRKIQVKVAGKGIEVRARKGYYAPLEGKPTVARKPGAPDPAFQTALDSPYDIDDIPLRATAYVFDETILGKAKSLVAADVDVRGFAFNEKDGRFVDTMEFLLVVAHRETGEYFRYDQKVDMNLRPETRDRLGKVWFPIVRDFELAPGGYQAKLIVRDKNGGRMGTVVHEFEVPDLAQFRVSTPVLTDTLQPMPDGEKKVPRPAMVARRSFPLDSTLYCQFEVYGAATAKGSPMPRVTSGYVIQRADGTVLTRVAPTLITPTSLGKLSRMVGSTLVRAEPGEYEFVLSVKDEIAGKTLELKEPFTVEAPSGG